MPPIKTYSTFYHLLRFWVRFSYKYIFYRRTEVRGREKFDPNSPLVFAPNHQNALMDALVFVTTLKQQPFFLARADLFKSNFLIKVFTFMKMKPVYRIRDGYENLQKNQEVFEFTTRLLQSGGSLCLFPEGNHNAQRYFRPLKKGLARIAFEAENSTDFNLGLKIVPTGIDYSHYDNVRGRLTVSYGDPITITDLKEVYRTDPQSALKELNNRIRKNIEPHMIEIPWMDIYDSVMELRQIYGARFRELRNLPGRTLFHKFDADKEMIRMIASLRETDPEGIADLNQKVQEYMGLMKKYNFRYHIPARAPYGIGKILLNSLWLALLFPLHVYSMVNNYHLFRIPAMISRKFKDIQFRATAAYVISMAVMMPISYALFTLIVGLIFNTWWIWVAYLITLLPSGVFMLHYMFENRKWRSRIRFAWHTARKNRDILRISELHKEIHSVMDGWTSR